MKHGKKPTRNQRRVLEDKKLNYKNWLVVKDTSEFLEVVHRESGKLRKYDK